MKSRTIFPHIGALIAAASALPNIDALRRFPGVRNLAKQEPEQSESRQRRRWLERQAAKKAKR